MRNWILLFVMMIVGSAWAQPATTEPVAKTQAVAKPTTAIPSAGCVTSECHANVKQFKVLHGPVNVNACEACHTLKDSSQHTFELSRDKTQTCTFCHQVDTHNDAVIHKPLKQGECLLCHNPHGGPTVKALRGNSVNDMCKSATRMSLRTNQKFTGL
jgi:predicted CXXCH cytochrome family protein